MKYYLFICLVLCALNSFAQKESYMLVGTYTNGSSKGIYVYKFNSANGESKQVGFVKSSNPSFIAVSPNEKYVYAVNEDADSAGSGGRVSSFSFDKITGLLTPINQKPSNGNHPCYVAIDKSGRWVIAGNYSSGTVAVLPVLKDGSLNNPVTTVQHYGKSINTERQNSPHVHATVLSPDNKFLFVPDLGLDKIMIYRFNKRRGKLKPATQPFIVTAAGTGPRHFVFHPNLQYAYLAEELTGNIAVFRYLNVAGHLVLIQNISTLPSGKTGTAGSADIHVSADGKFLYASNRGTHNSIVIFAVDKETGKLTLVGHQSTMGKTPRNFNFDPSGNFLLVANQNSDEIVIFKIDRNTGLLTDTEKRIAVSKPVCIKWIEQENK